MTESVVPHGARLGVDVGHRRIGVARSDTAGIMALPVATVPAGRGDVSHIIRYAKDYEVTEIIVGLPRNMDGSEGESARFARSFARQVARRISIPVRLVDERLSTVTAHRQLHEAGRKEISHREVVDQAAAVVILETALEQERNSGVPAGELVESRKKGNRV